jgi:hypothetical protein
MAKKFKKLEVELPRQPLSDQRVWQLAGLVFAFLILIFTLYTYLDYRNDSGSFQQQMDINNVESR